MSTKTSPLLKDTLVPNVRYGTDKSSKLLVPQLSATHSKRHTDQEPANQVADRTHTSLHQQLTHLREENSQLVTQSNRLISELENSSHQLLAANSKIGSLREELVQEKTDPERERVAVLEAQMKTLQDKLGKNASLQVRLDHITSKQQREREEWEVKQKSLHGQLSDVQEECFRLREACSLAEERASERELTQSLPYLNRSLTAFPSHLHQHSTPLKTNTHPATPLANSTLLNHSLLNGSTSSLSSTRSTQSARELTTRPQSLLGSYKPQQYTNSFSVPSAPRVGYHSQSAYPLKPSSVGGSTSLLAHKPSHKPGGRKNSGNSYARENGYTPTLKFGSSSGSGSGEGTSLELERAKAKIRQLGKEVLLLEQQLADKTYSAESHVEELTQLRTELAKERASFTMQQQEERERVAGELGRVRALHVEQCRELQAQVERATGEKAEKEREVARLKGALKASHSEVASFSERANGLMKQLDQERASQSEAMQVLQAEVEGGSTRVTQLEHALEACRHELEDHVTRVEEATQLHRNEVEVLKKQIGVTSSELSQMQQQLSEKTDLATQLQAELTKTKVELQQGREGWRREGGELRQLLNQSEVIRQSLLQQVERSSQELAAASGKLAHHQHTTTKLRQCQTEVAHLQRRVSELHQCKQDMERERQSLREERQRLMVEEGQLRHRLEQSEKQLGEMRVRCRELKATKEEGEREEGRLRGGVEKMKEELEGVQLELEGVVGRSKQREDEGEEALGRMQQELAKRAQQVLEMDSLLRNHQADTAARRLQLERTLAQRQGDLRARTQELEDTTVKYCEAQKRIEELCRQVSQLQSTKHSLSSEQHKQLQAKTSELASLQQKLKEAESVEDSRRRKAEEMRRELLEYERREGELKLRCEALERRVEQLQRESDTRQEQHVNQVQRLQETHTTLLASREQQASSHRLQLQQLAEQERVRQEELSRCRAQVASLSAELAAERQVGEEARRQVALSKAETARYQAQVSSLQRAFSVNNMANITLHRTGSASSLVGTSPTTHTHTPSPLPPHINTSAFNRLPPKSGGDNLVTMETTLGSEVESEVEFAQLPMKLSTPSLPHIHSSTTSYHHVPTSKSSHSPGKNPPSSTDAHGPNRLGEIINV